MLDGQNVVWPTNLSTPSSVTSLAVVEIFLYNHKSFYAILIIARRSRPADWDPRQHDASVICSLIISGGVMSKKRVSLNVCFEGAEDLSAGSKYGAWFFCRTTAFRFEPEMALPAYPTAGDAGILFLIIVNTAISISCVREFISSTLSSVVGIPVPSWDGDEILFDSSGCLRAPISVFVDEFRREMPTIPYKSLDCSAQECSICLTEFSCNARVNRLLCGHMFHKTCLEEWMSYWNPTCPLCRNDMMVKYTEMDDEDGDCISM